MKIAKYLFLLFVLLAFALFVFISTQPNAFSVSETQTINAKKEQVFNYVNDFSSWKSWWVPFSGNKESIKADSLKIDYSNNILEQKNSFAQDSIHFSITDSDFTGNSSLIFTSLDNNKSEITWKIKGETTFKTKFIAFFKGGMQNILDTILQESMENINNELKTNFDAFSIAINGFETKSGTQYIAISDSLKKDDFDTKRNQNFKKLGKFITRENITINGDPFVIFNMDSTKYLSCIPVISDLETLVVTDSLIIKGSFEPFLALKTTLKGNYTNRNQAWNEAKESIKKSNYKENNNGLYIEVYKNESKKSPSKNVTEIYIPVSKPVVIVNQPKKDSAKQAPTQPKQSEIIQDTL